MSRALLPPEIPLPPRDAEAKADLTRGLQALAKEMRQRNLDNAVSLALQAQRGRGELVEHFAELGRLYGERMGKAPPTLRILDGDRT